MSDLHTAIATCALTTLFWAFYGMLEYRDAYISGWTAGKAGVVNEYCAYTKRTDVSDICVVRSKP